MHIDEQRIADVTVLRLAGRLELYGGDAILRDWIDHLVDEGRVNLVLDMKDVTRVDSAGIGLPRSSRDMAALDVPKVPRKRLSSGDLVFFGSGDVSHVGIYVGENRFVHAPNTGGTVRLDKLDGPYWNDMYLFAKRVLR
jgi:hypothetical protein